MTQIRQIIKTSYLTAREIGANEDQAMKIATKTAKEALKERKN